MDEWDESEEGQIEPFLSELPKLSPESAARIAAERHAKVLAQVGRLDLLLIGFTPKEVKILRFLYRNATATVSDLRANVEDKAQTDEALDKSIRRLNSDILLKHPEFPLEIVRDGSRIWLEVRQ